jgi:predicted RNase H-like HicB family nuclease
MVKKATFSVVLYPQKGGGFTAICPEVQGCISQGETYEEALENIKDVIRALLEMNEDREDLIDSLAVTNKIFTEVEIETNV